MKKKIIVVAGPSGSGKTTLSKYLLEKCEKIVFSVSATTREARKNEVHGEDYYFLSQSAFEEKVKNEAFVEYEEVYNGIYYGTLKSEIERIWEQGQVPMLDIDVNGALHLRKQFAETGLFVFIHPVSEEKLRYRLQKRGTESEAKIEERIKRSRTELKKTGHFDKVIFNDNLQKARNELLQSVNQYLDSND